jgi:two-component system cell cycle response regulator DivK|tara:strand:+ start:80 stop:448 length:369 start_codon:yes stop_codon:yes gene_type:complete
MGKKILIVEDNEMNRDMLSRRLIRKGYEIVIAVDGAAGLEMMKSERPDLVLMDMGLPVMDGWAATANAKADETLKMIPIIALTAHALEADRVRALEAGADDFDTKPINLVGLLEKMTALLSA